ncbi:hypothetical protein [Ruegeria sp.]|uniref:hypothetical protein n=1 Tax=Ruegeria sp. TaxID=1879320 RepID=UPI00230E5279|nr:hypothetical protein [Ruegeria sp.]MDA7964868.1 hypothetical protein [Ruegeria sp.]
MQSAAGDGLGAVVSAMSAAADLMPFDPDELYGVLHFRLHTAKEAGKRSGWVGGRLYNRFAGESADYIPLSGTHLAQTFSAAGVEAPDFVVARGHYELRLDYAQKAYDALKEKLDAKSK